MSGELLTAEEAQELSGEAGDEPRSNAIQLVPVPAKIIVKDWGVLDCGGNNSWGYTPYGIFATGQKVGHDYGDLDPAEHDVLFPYNQIVAVEFDYPTYFQAVEDSKAKVQEAIAEATAAAEEAIEGDATEVTDGDEDSGD